MQPKFSLDQLGGACGPGYEEACRLFKPRRKYTLRQIIDAGVSDTSLAWFLFSAARMNSAVMPVLIAWARACADDCGCRYRDPRTPEECQAVIQAAIRHWAKAGGRQTTKGGRQWMLVHMRKALEEMCK